MPFCLDPRAESSFDNLDLQPSRCQSIAGSISHNSARSSQISMDFTRPSIDIPDDYPRRPDTIRLTPPRAAPSVSASASNTSASPSRLPSFHIGTIDEEMAVNASSPISHFPYQPPTLVAQHKLLSSRFSEDTIDDEPLIPHSASQGTFGPRLSAPRKSSGASDAFNTDSSRSSSMLHSDPSTQPRSQASAQAASDLYRRAYRFFDKEYTVQQSVDSGPMIASSPENPNAFGQAGHLDRPSLNGSDLSHEDSLPSSSRSRTSTQASFSDSASAWSTEDASNRPHAWAPVVVTSEHSKSKADVTLKHAATTLTAGGLRGSSSKQHDGLSIPSLPSMPSFNSSLTVTAANHAKNVRRRPSTADVYSQASQLSSQANSNLPLPALQSSYSSTDAVRYQAHSYIPPPAVSPTCNPVYPDIVADMDKKPTNTRLLRGRVASTPKLRLEANSLFPAQQALHLQHPVPPLPVKSALRTGDRRPSTSQTDGREPFFGRRFRSRTLGEADCDQASKAHVTFGNAVPQAAPLLASPLRPPILSSLSPAGATCLASQRHPSQASAISSELASPLYAMQPTPGSSICSASSPATTLSSLPVTPRTASAFPSSRPKSRGNSSASKPGGAGWASYLNSGLTLHLEGDHGRACQIDMTYLGYDPFGRPEQLVEGTEEARAITPKRPKSRGDKDLEAEQSGTLEFGPSDELPLDAYTFDLGRKWEASALLKHLTVGEETKADLLTRQAALSLNTLGNHEVAGYERKGRLAWKFAYSVEADVASADRRRLVPLRFSCSATLLNPERAKKSRFINLVKKQMVPTLASKAIVNVATPTDSPRSGSCTYEDRSSTATASPASQHVSNRPVIAASQLQPYPLQHFSSPVRRNTGDQIRCGAYNSPLRQLSRATMSSNRCTSADSSFCSQPTTPGRDAAGSENSARMLLQASPVSAQFGQTGASQRQLQTLASGTTAAGPLLQAELGQVQDNAGRRLQEKASLASLSASSMSSGSVHQAKPIMINGRKLIPISLPAGLARKSRIDPALLRANVVATEPGATVAERQRSTSMNSAGSVSDHSHQRRAPKQDANEGIRCLLSDQPRVGASSSRPPTASETIKREYLARTASEQSSPTTTAPTLRHQKSFAGAILTPLSFADEQSQARRRRSKTNEDGRLRPFTADAWGESQYPTREQQMRALSQQHRPPTGGEATLHSQTMTVPRGFRSAFVDGEGVKPLPAPPRPHNRPRTAQTITAAPEQSLYHAPMRAVQGVRS